MPISVFPDPSTSGSGGNLVTKANTPSQTVSIAIAGASTTAGTFGAWVGVATTSTDSYLTGLAVTQTTGNAPAGTLLVVEVGIGAAGSEVTIAALALGTSNNNSSGSHQIFPVPPRISAGQSVSVRIKCVGSAPSPAYGGYVGLMLVPYASVEGN